MSEEPNKRFETEDKPTYPSVSEDVMDTVDESLAHIERSRATMEGDLKEIDRLKTDTRAMLTRLLAA
ncbi:MAG: hypothetical protein MSG64_20455 [Pyrinomonadaceae bacterium MAG19_C2-C3]|nr:hypothetical protein [Pyrinomonadaceae bacterium MAG19_C2-C3]